MAEVRATQTGYYGNKIREPGDVFDVADGVTGKWFEPVHPLDHDADGKKGGSKPAKAKAPKPAPDTVSDDDKILKALEISGRTDAMTVEEAEAIIAAAANPDI